MKQKIEASLYTLDWGFEKIPFTLYTYFLVAKILLDVVNGGKVLQRKLKETIIFNKYDLKWKETSEKCKWEHCTR